MSFSTRDKNKIQLRFQTARMKNFELWTWVTNQDFIFHKDAPAGMWGWTGSAGALLCGFPIRQPEGFKAHQKIQSSETQIQSTETQTQSTKTQTQSTATRSVWQHCPPASERSLPSALLCSTHRWGEMSQQLRKVCSVLPPVCSDWLVQAVNTQLLREKRMIKAQTFNFVVFSGGKHTAVKITSKSTVWFLGSGFKTELSTL